MYSEQMDVTWDFCPRPFEGESFLSWFTRLAKENCSDVDLLYRKLRLLSSSRPIEKQAIESQLMNLESNKKLKNKLIENLSPFVDINLPRLKESLFNISEILKQWGFRSVLLQTPRYCPSCLKNDETPYFRYFWFLNFFTYCDVHKCILTESCPHCSHPIKFWKTNWNQSIDTCFNCNGDLKQGMKMFLKVEPTFQEQVLKIFKTCISNGSNFFWQSWKIALKESKIISLMSFLDTFGL